jgi:hypothetical protein
MKNLNELQMEDLLIWCERMATGIREVDYEQYSASLDVLMQYGEKAINEGYIYNDDFIGDNDTGC